MKSFRQILTPQTVAQQFGAKAIVRFETTLDNVAELHEANERSVCFLENPAYFDKAKAARPGLLLVPADIDPNEFNKHNLLPVPQPYMMFMLLVRGWLQADDASAPHAIHPSAIIDETATLGENVHVGPHAIIGAGCKIGDNTFIGPGCVLHQNVTLGADCRLVSNVTLYEDTSMGDRCMLHAGVVLGADGFGYLFHEGRQEKIPQVGRVELGNDVEIGANSCVDRSTLGVTRIRNGVKIDNLVQVGHNCEIDESTVLCAHVGLAGGTTIGKRCFLAGQVGSSGHLRIGDDVQIGGQTGVASDAPDGAKLFGTPAVDATHAKRMYLALRQLPDLLRPLKRLLKEQK